ncbi:MAG TPA: Flp pilus assembly protein CpaB [Pyrinomonadaceae bacterium]
MRNKRLIIALSAALVFGLIAAFSVSRYLASAAAYTKDLSPIVVAKVEIPVGSKIIAEQLAVVQFPRTVAPEGGFDAIDERLIGRVVVARIDPREPITESRLAPIGSAGGLSSVIPDGYRAMTVKVDDVVGVSGFILPGTLVDIVVVMSPPKNSGQEEAISKIVLQNIKVLASGQNIDKPKSDREVERAPKAVTLQVTPEQAEKLALASSEGKLQLVMRNSVDQADEKTPGANKGSLLSGERAAPVPEPGLGNKDKGPKKSATSHVVRRRPIVTSREITAAPRPAPERPSIEVIEGAKKRNVDFP